MRKIFILVVSLIVVLSGCSPKNPSSVFTATIDMPTLNPTGIPQTLVEESVPGVLLPIRGLFVHIFSHRNFASGFFSGEVIHDFNIVDPLLGHTVGEEVSIQLDLMVQMGINTIGFELRSSDPTYIPGSFSPPLCNIPPTLGLQYPNPTATELVNLIDFFELLDDKGIKIILVLTNTHMEEQPPTNNANWIGTILKAVKDEPALELVSFGGNAHTLGSGANATCGLPAEPPLWEGPNSFGATYVKWAINYAYSLGIPFRKLSAEAIIGDYYTMNHAPGYPGTTDGHLWDPISVLKNIFDSLSIPDNQRTYAVSFYEHRKCTSTIQGFPCEDSSPHQWAIETIINLFNIIGRNNGARVVAVEMGLITNLPETSPAGVTYKPILYDNWNTELAVVSLMSIMQAFGMEGGCFYRWVNSTDMDESDPGIAETILQRGSEFIYNPIKFILEELYTSGQTNDLILTSDNVPPVFTFARVMPNVVNNGEAINISVGLDQTNYFVTANISKLDTSNSSIVVLPEQNESNYQAIVLLNPWNEAENGIKQIAINAMDFWGNSDSTLIPLELLNSAPILDPIPPNDDFFGSTLNISRWREEIFGEGTVLQDERVTLITSDSNVFSSSRIISLWEFTGDFDVQVDFQIGEGWSIPIKEHLDGAVMGVEIAGDKYHITRLRNNNEDRIFAWSSKIYMVGNTPSTALAGKFRLIRIGTTLYLLYDTNNSWRRLTTVTVPSSPAKVYLGNASVNASHAFTTYFDNLQINSGLTTYLP